MQNAEQGLLLSNIMFALILQPAKSQCHPLKGGLTVATSVTCLISALCVLHSCALFRIKKSQKARKSAPRGGFLFSRNRWWGRGRGQGR